MEIKVEDNALYDVPALANMLNVSEKTIRKLLREEKLKGKKLAKKWYVTGSIIKAYFFEESPAKEIEASFEKKPKKAKK